MTNYQAKNCKRCLDCFAPAFAEQIYCTRCRRVMISAEDASVARERKLAQSKAEIAEYMAMKFREDWDVQIIDEIGRVVWARDLADRYRKELGARQHKDYRERS